jgi:CCR4-NOT transcription complex subunit 6
MLSWPYRRALIIQELLQADADILCLQEVQSDKFEAELLPELREAGYDGIYRQKSRDLVGQFGKVDGCAIFWRVSKLTILEYFDIDYNEEARVEATRIRMSDSSMRRFLTKVCKDNIAICAEFEFTSLVPAQRIFVANTHIYSGNNRTPDVKLLQTWILTMKIQQYIAARRQQGIDLPLLLCGDFNSLVDSSVYNFLRDGRVADFHPDFEEVDMSLFPDLKRMTHNLGLSSAMSYSGLHEPDFTNYTTNFRGTLDYIWYSTGSYRVEAYTELSNEVDILIETVKRTELFFFMLD